MPSGSHWLPEGQPRCSTPPETHQPHHCRGSSGGAGDAEQTAKQTHRHLSSMPCSRTSSGHVSPSRPPNDSIAVPLRLLSVCQTFGCVSFTQENTLAGNICLSSIIRHCFTFCVEPTMFSQVFADPGLEADFFVVWLIKLSP